MFNKILAVVVFLVVYFGLLAFIAAASIWSINTLFGLGIAYGINEICAAMLLVTLVSSVGKIKVS